MKKLILSILAVVISTLIVGGVLYAGITYQKVSDTEIVDEIEVALPENSIIYSKEITQDPLRTEFTQREMQNKYDGYIEMANRNIENANGVIDDMTGAKSAGSKSEVPVKKTICDI